MTNPRAAAFILTALVLGLTPAAPAGAAALANAAPPAGAAGSSGWSVQASPNAPGALFSQLSAVACPQPAACFAVGFSFAKTAGHTLPLAERWNGVTWTLQPIPTLPTAGRTFLTGVSCAAANRCEAVGYAVTRNAPGTQALTEAWNGTTWTLQATPQAGSGGAEFDAVSCVAAGPCVAVGGFSPTQGAVEQPLLERWNGSKWTVVFTPSPLRSGDGTGLDAVSCSAASACTAVGFDYFRELADTIYAIRWNGTSWALQKQPNPGVQRLDAENGVSCTGPSACTSAGYWTTFSAAFQQPLAEVWDGSTWVRQRIPQPADNHLLNLNGVSCASAASCIAVGDWSPIAGGGLPTDSLAERWNGTAWVLQHVPNPAGSPFASFIGVACVSATQCVAVGRYATNTRGATLVERYSG